MLKKRISLLLVILMLFTQYTYGIGSSSHVKAAAIEDQRNIITSVSMAVYGADGHTVTDSVYELDSDVTLDYTWSLPSEHEYKLGDTFTFQLPEQFLLFNDFDGILSSDDGDVGVFTVNQSTHQVVMTFNDYIETHDNVQGTLRIHTKFDKTKITGTIVQQILFPIAGGSQTVSVSFKPTVGSTIEKRGTPQGFNADHILWSVDVNKALDTVTNAVVTDPIPSGLSLDVPVTLAVYQLDILLDGTVIQGALLNNSKYTAEVTGGTLNVRFNDPLITSAYRIEYSTAITNDHQLSFTNIATLTGDGRVPASSSATVNVERGGSLKKSSTGYDWNKQTITWAIEYNYNNKSVPQGSAVLTDLFDDSQELVAESLKVYSVSLNSSGAATIGSLLTVDTDYTVTSLVENNKKGFKLQFTNPVTSPYRIEYKTKSTERVFKDTTITNTVSDSTYSEQATRLIRPAIIYKNVTDVDYQNKTVGWKVTFNADNYAMRDVVVTDTFPFGGLKFIPESLVIRDSNGGTVNPANYSLDYITPVQQNKGFKVAFNQLINGSYTISYTTEFNNDWIWSKTENFNNKVQIDWMDSSKVSRTTEAEGLFIPRDEAKNNGFKSGTYNAATKEITWIIGANYNGKTINDPKVVDVLTSGHALLPASLKVYTMNISKNGDPTKGVEVSSSKYTFNVDSNNQLNVEFKEPIHSAYYVEFATSLEGQLIGKVIENKANLYNGEKKVSKDLIASVTIPYGDEYVYKNGAQNGDKIDWSIQINPGQSTVKDVLIKDTPSPNQILLPDSFHLYPTHIAVNGNVTKSGPELIKDTDYTVIIKSDQEGKQSFELSFANDINKAYILEYQSLIVANTGEKVTNTVNFSGNYGVLISKDASKEIIVGVSSGSGTGSGVRGNLSIKKLDADDHLKSLSGATFTLYRLSGTERVLINSQSTDSEGTAAFNKIWLGNYVLIETAAPAGYVLDTTEHPITINSSTVIHVDITNKKGADPAPTPSLEPTATPVPTVTPEIIATPEPTANPLPEVTASPEPTATPGVPVVPTPTSSSAPEIIISDLIVPAGPGNPPAPQPSPVVNEDAPEPELVTNEQVPLGDIEIEDEEVPVGTVESSPDATKLPQTGENSPMPLYMIGIGLMAIGFIMNRVYKRREKAE